MLHVLRQIAKCGIKTEPPPAPADEMVLVARLQKKILRVLGRALTIRQVDAGSCNGCELEIHALANPYYNIEGLGIRFVASPRHADMLLVTGPVSKHMAIALKRTYDATPDPKLVVAVGDCGCGGGIFGESYASLGRVSNVIPVDVAIPGCPPAPVALLQGILAAITVSAPAAQLATELATQVATEPTMGAGAAEPAVEPAPAASAGELPARIGDPP
jgi:Ni,Fe-hydrogenase III small subunit